MGKKRGTTKWAKLSKLKKVDEEARVARWGCMEEVNNEKAEIDEI
jgi:hypothetical protein